MLKFEIKIKYDICRKYRDIPYGQDTRNHG